MYIHTYVRQWLTGFVRDSGNLAMGVLTRLRNDILCVDAIRHDPTSATSTQDDDADNGSSVAARSDEKFIEPRYF